MDSRIRGLQFYWRKGKSFDALRAQVYLVETKKPLWISNTQPLLKQLNEYLRVKKLGQNEAISDPHFIAIKEKFAEEMKKEYGLTSYLAKKRVDLKTKEFDFGVFIDLFFKQKSKTTAVANSYGRKFFLS